MKKIVLLCLFLLISTISYAATDYSCVNDCTREGYLYSYCTNKCSYGSALDPYYRKPKQIDYTCVNDCTRKGYMYNYCTDYCSY